MSVGSVVQVPIPRSPISLIETKSKPSAPSLFTECETDSLPKRLHCKVENQTNDSGFFFIINRGEDFL